MVPKRSANIDESNTGMKLVPRMSGTANEITPTISDNAPTAQKINMMIR
jgi:hypothetical protein